MNGKRRAALVLAAGSLLGVALLAASRSAAARAWTDAALLLPQLLPDAPLRPLERWGDPPRTQDVSFGPSEAGWDGLLFLPAEARAPAPGVVVALGVTPAGRDDPRVRRLGEGLARIGVAALVPYSPNLLEGRVTDDEIDFLVAAHQALAARPEVDGRRVGFLGVCVGASLSALAAADARIAEDVAFLGWFGGYHDLARLLPAVMAGATRGEDGVPAAWTPDPLARQVLRERLLALAPAERDAIEAALEAGQLAENAGLEGDAAVALALLRGPDLAEAERLVAALSPAARAKMRRLSPAARADAIRAPVYLMSEEGDRLIPPAETAAMAEQLGDRAVRVLRFTVFDHVDLTELRGSAGALGELWGLLRIIREMLGALR